MSREPRVSLVFPRCLPRQSVRPDPGALDGSTRLDSIGRGLAIVGRRRRQLHRLCHHGRHGGRARRQRDQHPSRRLLSHMDTPGLSVSDLMIDVRNGRADGDAEQAAAVGHVVPDQPVLFHAGRRRGLRLTRDRPLIPAMPCRRRRSIRRRRSKGSRVWQSIPEQQQPGPVPRPILDQYPSGTFAPLARARHRRAAASRPTVALRASRSRA